MPPTARAMPGQNRKPAMTKTSTPTDVSRFHTDIAEVARSRHTAKAYTGEELSAAQVNDLLDLLRYSASSVNSQPWHFVVGSTPEGRAKIANAGAGDDGDYSFNGPNIRACGMAVVFAARRDIDETYLAHLLEVEDADDRYPEPSNKAEMAQIREWFVGLMRDDGGSAHGWCARQTYWNGGQFLLGAAAMGLDATPMEGIDADGLDAEFGLADAGFRALFCVTVGRNKDADDWNFGLPKSRLPISEIVTQA